MKKVKGECTPGCGACCRVIAFPDPRVEVRNDGVEVRNDGVEVRTGYPKKLLDQGIIPAVSGSGAAFRFLEVRGVKPNGEGWLKVPVSPSSRGKTWWEMEYAGKRYVFFRSVCPQLTDEGMCRLHGTPDFPETCSKFPTVLDDLTMFSECTYEIVDEPITEEELITAVRRIPRQSNSSIVNGPDVGDDPLSDPDEEFVFVKETAREPWEEGQTGPTEAATLILPDSVTKSSKKPSTLLSASGKELTTEEKTLKNS